MIDIRSTVDPDTGNAACLVEWHRGEALVSPDLVLNTARELHAAASAAETDIALIRVLRDRMKADLPVVGVMLRDIRAERPAPPGRLVLRIEAIAGAKTGKPYVHIARGSMEGSLTPDEARQMALNWTETAVAALIDVRLRYVLGDFPQLTPDDVERIFTGLMLAGGDDTPERNT